MSHVTNPLRTLIPCCTKTHRFAEAQSGAVQFLQGGRQRPVFLWLISSTRHQSWLDVSRHPTSSCSSCVSPRSQGTCRGRGCTGSSARCWRRVGRKGRPPCVRQPRQATQVCRSRLVGGPSPTCGAIRDDTTYRRGTKRNGASNHYQRRFRGQRRSAASWYPYCCRWKRPTPTPSNPQPLIQ